MFDFAVFEDDGFLDACAGADGDLWPDGDVRPEFGGGVDGGGGVDVDWGHDCGGGLGDFGGLLLEGLQQVQCICRDGGASGFDLAPEVLGLEHEEAVAIGEVGEDVLFEAEDFVGLVIVGVLHVGVLEIFGRGVGD